MLDDFVQENGTPEQIEAYKKYCKKIDNAPAPASFIITNAEVAQALNNIVPLTQSGQECLPYKQEAKV